MWKAVEHLGFANGRALEPSAGVGARGVRVAEDIDSPLPHQEGTCWQGNCRRLEQMIEDTSAWLIHLLRGGQRVDDT